MEPAFHLAIGVNNLSEAKNFYVNVLGAKEGRSDVSWVDFNFFGHQLSCHLVEEEVSVAHYNKVDQKSVPIPHFGLIVNDEQFEKIKISLEQVSTDFILKPQVRFKKQAGEQKTMFFKDPSGNCIEIKSFKHPKGY